VSQKRLRKNFNSDDHFDRPFSLYRNGSQTTNKKGTTMNPMIHFKKIRILPLLIALALVAIMWPPVGRADAVTDWNAIASTAIVAAAPVGAGHQPYLVQPPSNPTDSKEAATATAAFRVLVGLFPGQAGTLQPTYDAYIAALPDNPPGSKAAGIATGEATASAMLTARTNDGRFGPTPTPYPSPAPPGIWVPTPPSFATDPAAWVGNVLPFIVPNAQMLRTDGPNALTSDAYAEDFNEVKELGSLTSITRTPDQTDAAIFWQDHGIALWNRIFRTLAANQNLNIVDSARLFAMENLAAADAPDRLLERQVLLLVLAPDHSDPRGRHRWQPGYRSRPDVAAAIRPSNTGLQPAVACHAALPRPPVGTLLRN
jgi:hypothetical protein